MIIKIKNINNYLICSLSCDSNKFNMIFFINVFFVSVEGKVYKFEMRFRTCAIRASIKIRTSIFKKTIMRKSNVKLARFTFFFLLTEHRERNILFLYF